MTGLLSGDYFSLVLSFGRMAVMTYIKHHKGVRNANAYVLNVAAGLTVALILYLGSLLTPRPMSDTVRTSDSVTVEVHRAPSR
jgi:hypothetical protein